jgi:hypothetical protein
MPTKQKASKQFPKPAKPHSLTGIVKKILADSEYARFIHTHVLEARKGNAAARQTLAAHFKPEAAELKALRLKKSDLDMPPCPGTTGYMLIDFAAPQHVWTQVNCP